MMEQATSAGAAVDLDDEPVCAPARPCARSPCAPVPGIVMRRAWRTSGSAASSRRRARSRPPTCWRPSAPGGAAARLDPSRPRSHSRRPPRRAALAPSSDRRRGATDRDPYAVCHEDDQAACQHQEHATRAARRRRADGCSPQPHGRRPPPTAPRAGRRAEMAKTGWAWRPAVAPGSGRGSRCAILRQAWLKPQGKQGKQHSEKLPGCRINLRRERHVNPVQRQRVIRYRFWRIR